ncbi:MAG: metalloregulator ArsR/SmtB family transcription factor [Pseudomonadota bacterium]
MLKPQQFFSCLAEQVRLASMLLAHTHGELCVCELVVALDENQSKVSRHLAQLRNCGLLLDRRQGQWVFYQLHPQLPDWSLRILDEAAQAEATSLKAITKRLRAMNNRPQRIAADA